MGGLMDFHSHVLPEIDDGSESVAMSLEMLKREWDQGIDCVVATPHFYANHDRPRRFLEKREASYEKLMEAADQKELPEILLGAEVHFFFGISEMDQLSELTIAGKQCILLEMPQSPWTDKMYREIGNIYFKQEIVPVIAHIDRYIHPFRTHGILERLEDLPVMIQANAGFFLRPSTKRMAMRMIQKNQIHLLGSDCHNTGTRPPRLGEAAEQIRNRLGDAALHQVLAHQSALLK